MYFGMYEITVVSMNVKTTLSITGVKKEEHTEE